MIVRHLYSPLILVVKLAIDCPSHCHGEGVKVYSKRLIRGVDDLTMATPAEGDAVVKIVRLFGVVVLRPDVVRFTEEAVVVVLGADVLGYLVPPLPPLQAFPLAH